jgi:hypothetical protein
VFGGILGDLGGLDARTELFGRGEDIAHAEEGV